MFTIHKGCFLRSAWNGVKIMFIILQLNHVVCRIAASTMSQLVQTPIVNVIGGYIYTNRGQGVIFMNTIF